MVQADIARPLEDYEIPHESAIVDASEVDALMGGASYDEARDSVRPLSVRKTDRVILYHPDPDNPSSVCTVPMNASDRRYVIQRLLQKTKVVNGKTVRWNHARPQVEPRDLPLRCFVHGCQRNGGFSTRAQLIAHVNGKHSNEAPMYARLIEALMEQIYRDIPADQYEMYGLTPPEDVAAPVKRGKG